MLQFEKGIDVSNYSGELSVATLDEVKRDFGVQFARVGAQNPVITRQQLAAFRLAEIEVDCLYITSEFQLDGARQLAREFNVPAICIDVEENCIESLEEYQRLRDLIKGEFKPIRYTRVSYWQPRWHNTEPDGVESWLAYYVPAWENQGPKPENVDFIINSGVQAGLAPVTCVQYAGTTLLDESPDLIPGLSCDLNMRWREVAEADLPVSETAPDAPPAPDAGGDAPANPPAPPAIPPESGLLGEMPIGSTPARYATLLADARFASLAAEVDEQYAYLVLNGVRVLRFGSSERDDYGQSVYPGRIAFNRGDVWYYLRTTGDGNLYQSLDEGD